MGLHHGIENALTVKLEHALSDVEASDGAGACASVQAFVNQVEAQEGKKIGVLDAAILLEEAAGLLEILGCTS